MIKKGVQAKFGLDPIRDIQVPDEKSVSVDRLMRIANALNIACDDPVTGV